MRDPRGIRDHHPRQKRGLRLPRQIRDRRLPHHDRLPRVLELSPAKPSTKRPRAYERRNTVTSKNTSFLAIYTLRRKVIIPYELSKNDGLAKACAGLGVGRWIVCT